MMFQALLVSKDDEAADILTQVFSGFDVAVVCCGYEDAARQLTEQKPDAVIVDFDETQGAAEILQAVAQSSNGKQAVTVVLLSDKVKVRQVIDQGANFVLYKPVTRESAETSLRAAISMVRRERRRSLRVPIQVPVQLKAESSPEVEAILLDLSEDGMDILAAQPLSPPTPVRVRFTLPDGETEIDAQGKVAWANPNGQAGVQLVEVPENVRGLLRTWVAANAPELPPQDPDPEMPCKLTDLSSGGCYVETESPFPEGSGITLCLKAEDLEAEAIGKVRVMHPGFGMGIEFASRTAEQHDAVVKFIEFLTSRPGTSPELVITPRALTAGDDYNPSENADSDAPEDPLLQLLQGHASLNQEDFLQQLRQQRSSESVASD
ncbi:MAG: PilZ domain-containing protein [Terriglobales bacterium]